MKERTRIKKSLFLSQIYTDLAAMRATLRELMRIMIYNTLFWVYYTCNTRFTRCIYSPSREVINKLLVEVYKFCKYSYVLNILRFLLVYNYFNLLRVYLYTIYRDNKSKV